MRKFLGTALLAGVVGAGSLTGTAFAAEVQGGDGHRWWGNSLRPSNGARATQSINPKLRAERDSYVYGPTIKPRKGSCIEVTTAYTHSSAEVWGYDWCQKNRKKRIAVKLNIDKRFQKKYGKSSYRVKIVKAKGKKNTWKASLYDRESKKWRKILTSSGRDVAKGGRKSGWNLYESYGRGGSKASFSSKKIRIKVHGKWVKPGRSVDGSGDVRGKMARNGTSWSVRAR